MGSGWALDGLWMGSGWALGIDERSPGGVFRGPLGYSPDLSKFIKMALMLITWSADLSTVKSIRHLQMSD
jgi:hypothetical protein